ncbi:MAG: hypothetical protein ACREUM_07625, partial [Nitrosospira sp.]
LGMPGPATEVRRRSCLQLGRRQADPGRWSPTGRDDEPKEAVMASEPAVSDQGFAHPLVRSEIPPMAVPHRQQAIAGPAVRSKKRAREGKEAEDEDAAFGRSITLSCP